MTEHTHTCPNCGDLWHHDEEFAVCYEPVSPTRVGLATYLACPDCWLADDD